MSTTPDTPTLRRGAKGPAVLRLQARLYELGYSEATPDGEFGPYTEKAVSTFQHKYGLLNDVIVGPDTWKALYATVPSQPATGPSFADWLVTIAKRDVGKVETPRNNQGAWIKKFWPSTSYPDGYSNREPYCAAAMSYWLDTVGDELAKAGLLESLTGMNADQFEKWRCKSAKAYDWQGWGQKAKGVTVLPDTATPQKGDIVVFDFSHIGLVIGQPAKGRIATVEANTGPAGERDGDGCWEKNRPQEIAKCFLHFNFA
jgi:hypothetical protein